MIAIVDYGAGNPVSVKKALDWLEQEASSPAIPRASPRRFALCFPAWAISRRRRISAALDCKKRLQRQSAGERPFWASVSACNGCSRIARKLRKPLAWEYSAANANTFPQP